MKNEQRIRTMMRQQASIYNRLQEREIRDNLANMEVILRVENHLYRVEGEIAALEARAANAPPKIQARIAGMIAYATAKKDRFFNRAGMLRAANSERWQQNKTQRENISRNIWFHMRQLLLGEDGERDLFRELGVPPPDAWPIPDWQET